MLKQTSNKFSGTIRFETGENILIQEVLQEQNLPKLMEFCENIDLLIIDEAQKIPNIGWTLKLLVDHRPELRILVSGSSSFEITGQTGEPLTGRKKTLELFPISIHELSTYQNLFDLKQSLENQLLYGTYPGVLNQKSVQDKKEVLKELTGSYLLKDVLELERIRASRVLLQLLRLLSWQIGSEVSAHELSTKVGLDTKTVAKYLDILEKAYVIKSLGGFSRNLRKEATRKQKYYFYDLGLRNTLIGNFNPLVQRDDTGQLWENFLIIERLKYRSYTPIDGSAWFWRTWDQKEIDYLEERDGKLFAYEFKWNPQTLAAPALFLQKYPNSQFSVIHRENYLPFLTGKAMET